MFSSWGRSVNLIQAEEEVTVAEVPKVIPIRFAVSVETMILCCIVVHPGLAITELY